MPIGLVQSGNAVYRPELLLATYVTFAGGLGHAFPSRSRHRPARSANPRAEQVRASSAAAMRSTPRRFYRRPRAGDAFRGLPGLGRWSERVARQFYDPAQFFLVERLRHHIEAAGAQHLRPKMFVRQAAGNDQAALAA